MATSVTHLSVLKKLRGDVGEDNLGANTAKTLAAMDARYSFSSTRVALAALRKEYPDNKEYIEEMKKRGPKWKDMDESQEPTDAQKAKYVSWDNILEFRDLHYEDMTPMQRLLMALYTYIPPVRLDFTPMRIVSRKPKALEDGMNYYVRNKAPYFIFHSYKTHNHYGDKVVKIPKKLQAEIDLYVPATNTYLLQDDSGAPWQEARISQNVSRIFKQFHKLNTGVSMFRHSYATKFHAGQLPLAAIKKTASAMMHGPLQSMSYRFLSLE